MTVSRRTVLVTAAGAAAAHASSVPAAGAADGEVPASAARTPRSAADYAVEKVGAVAPGATGFPVGTRFEKWVYSQNGDWVGGFWPGTLWMAYLHSGDERFRAQVVVARCTRNRPAEDGIEISLPYADYYLLEGILRVLRPRDVDRAIDLSTV
ncbi:hypothetical protein [Streptomyces sp. NPDC007904]|jgi:hypothetical protein|uniref:hypothetical protein n=1 Tax=Streptomyces sp. NPDC007904 TaxID=3364787 RepID=UPI0036DFE2CD